MKITLRKYRPEDATPLLALFYDTVHEVNIRDYSLEQISAWAPTRAVVSEEWQSRLAGSQTIVATYDDSLIGFGNLDNNGTSIGMLYVSRKFLGKGVGKAILKKLEKKLTKAGVSLSEVQASISARPFFEGRGYTHIRDNKKVLNGVEFLNFVMQKKLKQKKIDRMKDRNTGGVQWREIFANKGFDLMIVILGVSIAFQLNNWKNESDQKSMERFYKESLISDLNQDISEMKEIMTSLEEDRRSVSGYLGAMENQPADSLVGPLLNVLSFETFNGNSNTYETLVASTGLNTFSDRDVVSKLAGYYTTYTSIRRFETVYTGAILELNRHFNRYVIYDQRRIVDARVRDMPETRNYMLIALSQLTGGLEDYQESLEAAEALKQAIEGSL